MQVNELRDKLLRVVADTLDVPVADVSIDSSCNDLKPWDSVGHIMVMLAVEQGFGVKFSVSQIEAARSVRELESGLLSLLESRAG